MYVSRRQMDNKNVAIIVVVVIVSAVSIIIFASLSMSISYSSECRERSDELDQRLMSLETRSNTIGGQIDWGGELEAEYDQYNMDIAQYNADCA